MPRIEQKNNNDLIVKTYVNNSYQRIKIYKIHIYYKCHILIAY